MRIHAITTALVVLLLTGLLSACGNDDDSKSKPQAKNKYFFMKDQVATLNKAKAVEGLMRDHVRQEMQQADAQSQ